MVAIVLGMIVANILPLPRLLLPGLKFTTKKLLPLAIILLGARLDFMAVVRVGVQALAMSVGTILLGVGLFVLLIEWGWVPRKLGLLLGVGTAICGGTAIVAAAPIIDADEKDVSFSIATVTLCGLAAMFLLPLVGELMHLSDRAFGIWAGLAIQQTPQVIAAGFAYSQPAGDTATIVKLRGSASSRPYCCWWDGNPPGPGITVGSASRCYESCPCSSWASSRWPCSAPPGCSRS